MESSSFLYIFFPASIAALREFLSSTVLLVSPSAYNSVPSAIAYPDFMKEALSVVFVSPFNKYVSLNFVVSDTRLISFVS